MEGYIKRRASSVPQRFIEETYIDRTQNGNEVIILLVNDIYFNEHYIKNYYKTILYKSSTYSIL